MKKGEIGFEFWGFLIFRGGGISKGDWGEIARGKWEVRSVLFWGEEEVFIFVRVYDGLYRMGIEIWLSELARRRRGWFGESSCCVVVGDVFDWNEFKRGWEKRNWR